MTNNGKTQWWNRPWTLCAFQTPTQRKPVDLQKVCQWPQVTNFRWVVSKCIIPYDNADVHRMAWSPEVLIRIRICLDLASNGRYIDQSNGFLNISLTVNVIRIMSAPSYCTMEGYVSRKFLLCPSTCAPASHYTDVIMGTIAPQITSLTRVYSTVYSDADKKNITAPRHWPLCGDRWIPCTNGQ